MGGNATLDSYGSGRDIPLIHEDNIEFLEGYHDFHEADDHVLVHANDFPDPPMAEQPVVMLRWESLRDTTPCPYVLGKAMKVGHTFQKGGETLDLGHS